MNIVTFLRWGDGHFKQTNETKRNQTKLKNQTSLNRIAFKHPKPAYHQLNLSAHVFLRFGGGHFNKPTKQTTKPNNLRPFVFKHPKPLHYQLIAHVFLKVGGRSLQTN